MTALSQDASLLLLRVSRAFLGRRGAHWCAASAFRAGVAACPCRSAPGRRRCPHGAACICPLLRPAGTVEPMDIESFLAPRSVARASTLHKAGFSRTYLGKALAAGRIVRIRRGVYSLPREADVLGLALQHNALLTCLSAAPTYRLWTLHSPGSAHLSPGHKKTPSGTVVHGRCAHPPHRWLPVAGLADVLIHALRCLPAVEALVMVQCAAQRGDVTVDFLRRKLPGNRNARARSLLDYVIPRADSVLEVLANYHFRRAGLHVRRHVELPGVGRWTS